MIGVSSSSFPAIGLSLDAKRRPYRSSMVAVFDCPDSPVPGLLSRAIVLVMTFQIFADRTPNNLGYTQIFPFSDLFQLRVHLGWYGKAK